MAKDLELRMMPRVAESEYRDSEGHVILNQSLSDLTVGTWRHALEEALNCLDREDGFRGRGRQLIAKNGSLKEMEVSPHLQLYRELWCGAPPSEEVLVGLMREARRQLLPLHAWASASSARTRVDEDEDIAL